MAHLKVVEVRAQRDDHRNRMVEKAVKAIFECVRRSSNNSVFMSPTASARSGCMNYLAGFKFENGASPSDFRPMHVQQFDCFEATTTNKIRALEDQGPLF